MNKRRFRVYLDHGYAGCPDEEEILEFDRDTPDQRIEKECRDAFDGLVSNLNGGWYELTEGEEDE